MMFYRGVNKFGSIHGRVYVFKDYGYQVEEILVEASSIALVSTPRICSSAALDSLSYIIRFPLFTFTKGIVISFGSVENSSPYLILPVTLFR